MSEQINTNMQIEQWPIENVKPYDKNPRRITPEAIRKVAESIKEFGFRQPIVVDEHGFVLVGHTRLSAAKSLGLANVPVHVAKGLTEAQARAYRLADNKVHEFSDWDTKTLDQELKALANMDMSTFGFEQALEPDKTSPPPEVQFSEELLLEHNYVLFYFDNALDWQVVKDRLNLSNVKDLVERDNPSVGLGRVVNGKKLLELLNK